MSTLKEVKEDLRSTVRELKWCLRNSLKDENSGVDKYSGHHGQTGRYEMKVEIQAQVNTITDILKMLSKVRKIK